MSWGLALVQTVNSFDVQSLQGEPAGVESTVVDVQKVLCDIHFAVIPLLVLDPTALLLHTQLSFPYAALTSQGLGLVGQESQ